VTYSIIGRDAARGEIGAAVQSKFPGAGSIVLHGAAGAGCLTTQAFANPRHGADGLALLQQGLDAPAVLAALLGNDPAAGERQVAVLGPEGPPALHTGDEVRGWDGFAGGAMGRDCVACGNTLAGEQVPRVMVDTFAAAPGELAERLIAALAAGRDAGGELRGQQSAAVLVVKPGGGYGGWSGRHVDISVYDHPAPIDELARCYRLHRLSYFPSDPTLLVPVDAALARELKAIMGRAGFRDLPDTPDWGEAEIALLKRFMGTENYDNRLRDDALMDTEVLADLRRRYPARGRT
jgi:uncharacterized Ntn-hydrolase superfamily protein